MPKQKISPKKTNKKSEPQKKKRRLNLNVKARRQTAKEARQELSKVSSAWRLLKDSISLVRQYWRLFGGIGLAYVVLTMILVGGIGSVDIGELKTRYAAAGETGAAIATLGTLIGTGTGNSSASAYQLILTIIASLATVWALRQLMAGSQIRVKDAFYKGMYPLVPVMLVVGVMLIQLIPAAVGSFILSAMLTNGVAVGGVEVVVSVILTSLLVGLSLYMLISSLFALYVATLPDTPPMEALRSARNLVQYRRISIFMKLMFLPLVLLIVAAIVMLPVISVASFLVAPVFGILSAATLIFSHVYIYSLYRELL